MVIGEREDRINSSSSAAAAAKSVRRGPSLMRLCCAALHLTFAVRLTRSVVRHAIENLSGARLLLSVRRQRGAEERLLASGAGEGADVLRPQSNRLRIQVGFIPASGGGSANNESRAEDSMVRRAAPSVSQTPYSRSLARPFGRET